MFILAMFMTLFRTTLGYVRLRAWFPGVGIPPVESQQIGAGAALGVRRLLGGAAFVLAVRAAGSPRKRAWSCGRSERILGNTM